MFKDYIEMQPITCYKLNWRRGAGSQDIVLTGLSDDHIPIAFHTKRHGRGWSSTTPKHLVSLLDKNRNLFEVLHSYPKKAYFDVDFVEPPLDFNQDSFIADMKRQINEYLPDIDLAVSGSVTKEKASYHLVATNYIIEDADQMQQLKLIVKAIETDMPSFDSSVYTKNRQMKLPNQSKPNKPNVQLQISTHPIETHIVTAFFSGDEKPIPQLHKLPEEKANAVDAVSEHTLKSKYLTTLELPNPSGVCWNDLNQPENAEKLLALIPNGPQFDHWHSIRVCNFCVNANVRKELFLTWLKQKDPSNMERIERYDKKVWDSTKSDCEIKPNIIVSQERMRSYLPNWYPKIKPIDADFDAFKANWYPPVECTQIINKIEVSNLEVPQKYVFFTNAMGTGKTNTLIEYLKREHGEFLWIAPRVTLVNDTYERMQVAGLSATHYNKLGEKKHKLACLKSCEKSRNVILCLNSLHYLMERDFPPQIIVIDELETILNTLAQVNEQFIPTETKVLILKTLRNFIRKARLVICLDAFTTLRSIRFATNMGGVKITTENCIVYDSPKPNEPTRKIVKLGDSLSHTTAEVLKGLLNGERIFMFYPLKKPKQFQSMDGYLKQFINSAKKCGYKGNPEEDFVCYHGDTDQRIKHHITDVNKYWATKKLVICNTVITAGVSYTNISANFDKTYMFIAPFNSPRDIAQVSYRARNLTTKTIYISYLAGMRPEAWERDTAEINMSAYTQLYEDSLVEFKSPQQQTLMLFFHRANYEVADPIQKLSIEDAIVKNVEASVDKTQLYSFDAIDTIDHRQFKSIVQDQLVLQNTTTSNILAVRKYVFSSHFKQDTPSDVLKQIWDCDKCDTISIIHDAKSNPDSFESIIARDNNWRFFPCIEVPTRRWNVILSDEAKAKLCGEWATKKYDKDPKKINMLLKSIYNTKYRDTIIGTGRKGSNVYWNTKKHDQHDELLDNIDSYYVGKVETAE